METERLAATPPRSRGSLPGRNLRRAGAALSALALAALLAGCGTAASTPAASAAKGPLTTTTGGFNPSLVPAGGSSPGTNPDPKHKKKAKKKPAKKASAAKPAKSSKSSGSSTASASGSSPSSSGTSGGGTGGTPSGSTGGSLGGSSGGPSGGGTVVVTVPEYPHVPPEAGVPSRYPALHLTRFDTDGGNIGCRIRHHQVRCDVANRVWSTPAKPSSCHAAWGQGLMVGPKARHAYFVCARSSVLDPTGKYIHAGYDDHVGGVTCQIRGAGVTCFESDGHGFFIGRTGYKIF